MKNILFLLILISQIGITQTPDRVSTEWITLNLPAHQSCQPTRDGQLAHGEVSLGNDPTIIVGAGGNGIWSGNITTAQLELSDLTLDFSYPAEPMILDWYTLEARPEEPTVMISLSEWDCSKNGHLDPGHGWTTLMYCPPYYERQGETIYRVYPGCNTTTWECNACGQTQSTKEETTRVKINPKPHQVIK